MKIEVKQPKKKKNKLTLTTSDQRIARRQLVWDMRIERGMSSHKIAKEIGINQSTVWRDIKAMAKIASANLEEQVTQETAAQVARLNHVVAEAMAAWEQSKKHHTSLTERTERVSKKDATGEPTGQLIDLKSTVSKRIARWQGNPAFLETAIKAMADIRRILAIGTAIDINLWQKELAENGIDPAELFEELVQKAADELNAQELSTKGVPIVLPGVSGEKPK
jgi:transposase